MSNEFGSLTGATSAGALLRAAREKQGLHIAALAAAIKVAPRKLEALERDRYEELAGATFTRALAQSVCRALRIDAKPVLALLPQADAVALDQVAGTLNTPFHDRPSRDEPGIAAMAQRSLVWAGLVLLLAAIVTYFVPITFFKSDAPAPRPEAAATTGAGSQRAQATPAATAALPVTAGTPAAATTMATASPSASSSTPAVPAVTAPANSTVAATTSAAMSVPGATDAAATPSGVLQMTTTESSWIEVRDATGRVLLSRIVMPSEAVGLDGTPPLRVVIGNAGVTQVMFRGKPVNVAAGTRDNVARLELN